MNLSFHPLSHQRVLVRAKHKVCFTRLGIRVSFLDYQPSQNLALDA